MPPKKLKSREGNPAALPDLVSKFPFRVGDEVEMKSHESGYRGAWFRVQIKKVRLDRKGNIWSMMVYKDYTDESEEEIRVYERDPASDEPILMVRPLPPPSVKESKFNKSVHTKMCVVYRDEWEVGDLVDWWYHHCWWAAKVISVVGDGRFQLVCPAPPGGEGGVYLANSRDLRPSLKWSIAAQWTAPPSKEIGKIPCARIVWLLDSNEVAGFAATTQDHVPYKRGRSKLVRGVSDPPFRKEPSGVAPAGKESGTSRRPRVIQLNEPPYYSQRAAEAAAPNKDTRVPQKRGRPRKVDGQEEAATKRRKPITIKIIHPRQDPGNEKVEQHIAKISPVDEMEPGVNEERAYDLCPTETSPEEETRRDERRETTTQAKGLGDDENRNWVKKASPLTERQPEKVNAHGIEEKTSLAAKHTDEQKRPRVTQKRSVIRLPDKINMTKENQVSNGHSDEAKRRKLEHIRRVSAPEAGDEHRRKHLQDQVGKTAQKWTAHVEGEEDSGGHPPRCGLMMAQSKSRKEDKVAVSSTTHGSRVWDVVDGKMPDLVPREETTTLPCLSEEGKESSADQISGQQSKEEDEKQNGERQVEVFSSNFASNPMNGEVNGEACKAALDLKVLKVLNAYEEAFTDNTLCLLEAKNNTTCLTHHDPSAKEFKDALMNDSCPTGLQKSVLATKDLSVVKASEEAVPGKDIRSPRKKSSLAHRAPQPPSHSKLAKSRECPVSCNQKKKPQVSSTCKGISSPDTKSSTLQGRHTEKAANVSAITSREFIVGKEASSMDTVSAGGSPDSFSGRMATAGIEEDVKETASSHGGASVVDEEDSWSSLELSQANQSRKSANVRLNTSRDAGKKAEKCDKNDFSSLRKRNVTKPMIMKRKVSLSRKLIDQARREVSAKRRRSCRSTETGRA